MPNKGNALLVPKLRFPEFQGAGEWKAIPLDRLATRCKQKNRNEEIDRVLINSAEFGVLDQRDFFDKDIATQGKLEGYFVVELGDYVYNPRISASAPVGPISKNNIGTGVMSPLYTVFQFKDSNNDFYQHYFKTTGWHPYMRQVSSTGARHDRMAISSEGFMAMPLPVSSPEEQQKIADCLSSLDELIAAQARKVDALKTHKKGLMQQLFPREGETQPRLRFPEFRDAGAWKVNELGSVSDVRDGTHDSPSFFPTGRPLVTSKNLWSDGTLDLENVSLISEEDYAQINKRSKVSIGDILFGMIGTIGNPVLVKSEGFAIKNVALIKEAGALSNSFLVQLLQSGYVAAIFAVLNTGNSQKFIALGKIRGLPVPLPSLSEQQHIADCLTSIDDLITAAIQALETLKTHKKGLMQQLFPSAEAVEA